MFYILFKFVYLFIITLYILNYSGTQKEMFWRMFSSLLPMKTVTKGCHDIRLYRMEKRSMNLKISFSVPQKK